MRASLTAFCTFSLLAIAAACSDDDGFAPTDPNGLAPAAQSSSKAAMQAMLDGANVALAGQGSNVRVGAIEYLTENGEDATQTVFFNNRGNKQLGHHFVPGDPRRDGRTNITYLVDQSGGNVDALTTVQTEAAIDRAMATWDGESCSDMPIAKNVDDGSDPDLIDELSPTHPDDGLGGIFAADLVHAGWVPAGAYPLNVIAATHTFIFTDVLGNPTDIDGNGKADTAWREIYYHDAFAWRINANIDVETIALHEAGHGLSQGHFGSAFRTNSNGKLHFAPLAVMNAAYSGIQQALAGTDNGGHCSIWGGWPNN